MKVLITGAKGFIGKNLVSILEREDKYEIICIDRENSKEELEKGVLNSDFIVHLAGINRPKNEEEFFKGNTGLTEDIIEILKENNKNTSILITSSIQADLDNAYGQSKKGAEEALIKYMADTKGNVFIFRLPNVFGKWCRPNYNSAIATFCHNIARGEEVWISDPTKEMTLVYIDDVVRNIKDVIDNEKTYIPGYQNVDIEHKATLGEIVDLINFFKESRKSLMIPNMENELTKKLYSTYLSYLPEKDFSYPLKMNVDNRGSFTEFIKSKDRGQVSVNISKPGITKGNHWHDTKNEKFLVVSGEGVIRFRKVDSEEIIEYKVSGEKLEVVDIPVGYTHSIINTGERDMVTIMWVNEIFNPEKPDTIYLEVENEKA
ncbi:TPA: NAD-dependent epimerase/dehydratase family protein [Clostridium perfringens]|uniref:polysaccharide biosynthesis C-terminal domain-containing protein n=1 Tax=Clostridium perfringens TaxID=1502 RepID=UPI000D50F0E5|nr:NAD-dependent epimerase/dehydratase family protein [Clostridium perfringens]EIF6296511.1 NAD-dependent epimerase/dehydratase family protein [Clostridium perfringens]EIF6298194.1 NAD-dependent epimerase/dehydratase family protein [Clostridium perfringens]ELC8404874.1 NAD-dependent epimerase/dehydratase family protein [Clostridium perfringens]ELC8405857.1 NAD-dependent epimerase/dehydratase family protein [Clostridium perfringens]PVE16598.1 capsular biosynthesis protein [Clostridium perfringe